MQRKQIFSTFKEVIFLKQINADRINILIIGIRLRLCLHEVFESW